MHVKSPKARSAVSVAALAAVGVTGLVAAPAASAATTASAAPAATAALAVDVPLFRNNVGFQSVRIDNGTSVTCIAPAPETMTVVGLARARVTVDYQISAGTSYGVSAWSGYNCGADGWGSLGGVTVTPTAADVSSGVYWVTIP